MKIVVHVLLLALLVLATKAEDFPPQCEELVNDLAFCVIALEDGGDACLECYGNAFPAVFPGSCQEGEDVFCAGFAPCKDSCGNCVDDVYTFLDCVADDSFGNCNIDCEGITGGTGEGGTGSAAPAGHLVTTVFSVMGAMVTLSFI